MVKPLLNYSDTDRQRDRLPPPSHILSVVFLKRNLTKTTSIQSVSVKFTINSGIIKVKLYLKFKHRALGYIFNKYTDEEKA